MAIKCLRPDRIDDDSLLRLSLEATTLARISYPGIVTIHDVIADDSGLFMVMEYLSGGTLRERLERPLDLGQALEITISLARALDYAHEQGIIHRDLKPGNILFRDDGTPVITDFGIVYYLDTRQSQRLTQTGTFLGTPTYLSPEQIRGEPGSCQSDLYALGIVMYEMLTGKAPFCGDTIQSVIYGHLSQPAPPLPAYLSPLQSILDQLLAKQQTDRFASGQALIETLKSILQANPSLLKEAARQPAINLIDSRQPEKLMQARQLLDDALQLDSNYAPALAASGELWLHLSNRPSAYGDIPVDEADAAAVHDLEKALLLNPNLAEAHAAMGLLAILDGDTVAARSSLARALELNPSLAGASNWQAGMLQANGMANEALRLRSRFALLDPLFPVNRSNLAIAQRLAGHYAAAERTSSRLQSEFPENHLGWMSMLVVLTDQGRLAEAVAASRQALALEPDRFLNRLYSERLYFKLAEFEQSAAMSVGYYQARALFASGQAEEARQLARQQMDQPPDNLAARIGLIEFLALAGLHQDVLDLVAGLWGDAATLEEQMPKTSMIGDALAPLAIAQRELGLGDELADTLAVWGRSLEMMKANGNGSTPFHFAQARYHALAGQREPALSGLAEAIARGYRNPLLGSDPAFADLHDDPEFLDLVERVADQINADRAQLNLPLVIPRLNQPGAQNAPDG